MRKLVMATLLGLALLGAGVANAATMTFDGLSGTYYGSYTENGLTATPPSNGYLWAWPISGVAHLDPGSSWGDRSIDFSFSGGKFNLLSVEILTIGGSGANNGLWEAFSNGTLVGSINTDSLSDHIVNFGNDFSNVDLVRVTNANNHFSFDNLNYEPASVPEPSTIALVGLGIAGVALLRRRSKQ